MTITVCMGSSCFSRGNSSNTEAIQKILDEKRLTDSVTVKGCLCEGQCKNGPNIRINETLYSQVTLEMLEDILLHEYNREQGSSV
ncbi:MAG: (2Fe-2S) ferredoxin domain-containing protein [Spirochaetales bacterium]